MWWATRPSAEDRERPTSRSSHRRSSSTRHNASRLNFFAPVPLQAKADRGVESVLAGVFVAKQSCNADTAGPLVRRRGAPWSRLETKQSSRCPAFGH